MPNFGKNKIKDKKTREKKLKNFFLKIWPLIFIVFVWLIFSHKYFLNGLIPFPTKYLVDFFPPWNNFFGMPVKNNAMPDIITQIFPWKKIVIDALKQGQIPFWNPYQFSGNLHLANFQSAVFTPFNLLFIIFSLADAWSLLILLQPLLAGLFAYLYVRKISVSKLGSLISATSFMFGGFIVCWMGYGTMSYAILYLPLLLFGIESYFGSKNKFSALIIVISVPLSFFSGHFQTSLYLLLVSTLYIGHKYLMTRKGKTTVLVLLFIIAGLVLSAIQIIPSIKFYEQSVRSEIYSKVEVIPWNYIVSLIAPDFFGNPVTRNDWFGHYAEWAGFAGVIPLFLAFLSLFRKKKGTIIYFFLFLSLFSLLLAYNTFLVDILVRLKFPVISTSAFSRIIVLFSFAVSVLSGFGFDFLSLAWTSKQEIKKLVFYLIFWLSLIFFVWSLLFANNIMFSDKFDFEKLSVAKRNFIFPTIILLIIAVFSLAGFIKSKAVKTAIPVLIILLSVFDLLRFSLKWMPFEEKKYLYPEIQVLTFLSQNASFNRVFGNIGNEGLAPFGLYGIEGYDPLYIRRYGQFIVSLSDGRIRDSSRSEVRIDKNGEHTKKGLDLLGVKFIFHSKGDGKNSWVFPFWLYEDSFGSPIYSDDYYEVYENKKAYPRAFLVHDVKYARNDQEIIDIMFDSKTDLLETIVLEENLDEKIVFCSDDNEKVLIVHYQPNSVELRTEANCTSLLFLSDSFYPGWNVYVNSQKVKIYRADYSFRAVIVPKGKSSIKFAYENWYL